MGSLIPWRRGREPGNEARFVGITIYCVFVTDTYSNECA